MQMSPDIRVRPILARHEILLVNAQTRGAVSIRCGDGKLRKIPLTEEGLAGMKVRHARDGYVPASPDRVAVLVEEPLKIGLGWEGTEQRVHTVLDG